MADDELPEFRDALIELEREKALQFKRKQVLADTISFGRDVLGYTKSKVEWEEIDRDGKKTMFKDVKEGLNYGISRMPGPDGLESGHVQIVRALNSDSFYVHIEAPRDAYKTSLALVWLLQNICADRNIRILYLMETLKEAQKKVEAVGNHIEENPGLHEYWPDLRIVKHTTDGGFIVSGRTEYGIVDPTIECGGIGVNITGSHRDIIVMDDPVNWQNVRDSDRIAKTREYFNSVLPVMDPGTKLVVIGTRYDFSDLYGDILSQMDRKHGGDFECIVLDCGMQLLQAPDLSWQLVGKPRFWHLNERYLKAKLMGGHAFFSSQYLNRCLSTEAQLFYRQHFNFLPWMHWMPNLRYFIFVDTATATHEKGCYSCIAVVGLDAADNAYLVDMELGRWSPHVVVGRICDAYQRWTGGNPNREPVRIHNTFLERVSLNVTFRAMLQDEQARRGLKFRIDGATRGVSDGSKDQRIQASHGRFEQGRFYVVETVPRYFNDGLRQRILFDPTGYTDPDTGLGMPAGELVDQYIRFPAYKFKDAPDCLADLEATDKDGRRLCLGQGVREELRISMARRAGRAAPDISGGQRQLAHEIQRQASDGFGSRWSEISRGRGGRYG